MKDNFKIFCKTEKEKTVVLKEMEKRGYVWRSGEKPTDFDCGLPVGLCVQDGRISYANEFIIFNRQNNLESITVDEFLGKSKNECIVIYRNDREVIALDKCTGKTATAKCHPTDKFDFVVGAKLALDRLTGTMSEETTPTLKFKVGDRVIGNAKASEYHCITREGWKGYVTREPNDGYMMVSRNKTNINAGYLVRIDCFELDDSPEYFNGNVVCVESKDNFLTKGRIYEFDDGLSADDNGAPFPYAGGLVESVEELNQRFQSDFIEVVE